MKTYSEFYEQAKESYGKKAERDLYAFGMLAQTPDQKMLFNFSEEYLENINILSEHIKNTIEIKENQLLPGSNMGLSLPTTEEPIIRYKNVWDLPGLEKICEELMPQIESKVLGSYSYVYGLYVYRNQPCSRPPRASWLWHYDNHPKETLKLMIYLTDTEEDNGCFEIMTTKDNKTIKQSTLRVDKENWQSHHSRIGKKEMEKIKKEGAVPTKVLGPKGTVCLFDNNIVH